MNLRIHLIAERLWGAIALIALLASCWHISDAGWEVGKTTLVFPGIAGAWYFTRRGLRRRMGTPSGGERGE